MYKSQIINYSSSLKEDDSTSFQAVSKPLSEMLFWVCKAVSWKLLIIRMIQIVNVKMSDTFITLRYVTLCFRLFGSNRIRIAKNKTRIIGVSSTDNGVYSCRASNPAGFANSVDNFLLTVPGLTSTLWHWFQRRQLYIYIYIYRIVTYLNNTYAYITV